MDKLFLSILNMSMTGAFVIAAICLARLLLKKAPKIISYCLWAVAFFRLICPISIEAALSLVPFKAETIPTALVAEHINRIDSGIAAIDRPVNDFIGQMHEEQRGNESGTRTVYPLRSFVNFFACVWVTGAAAFLIYGVVSFAVLKRKMRGAARLEGNLFEAGNVRSPFVLGVLAPKIYLPSGLSEQERGYIVLHERTHIRRHDHIVKFAAYFILCLHWFNPLAWAAFLLMGIDMEMSCDERVLKEMGGETKKDYSLSLLSLAAEGRNIGGSPLAFSEGGIKERIKRVLNFKKPSRVIIVAAIVLAVALSAGFAMNKASEEINGGENGPYLFKDVAKIVEVESLRSVIIEIVETDALQDRYNNKNIFSPGDILRAEIHFDVSLLETAKAGDLVWVSRGNSIALDTSREPHTFLSNGIVAYTTAIVTIQVWKGDDGNTRFTLFDGDVTDALSELTNGRVLNDIAELNAALAEYRVDYTTVRIKHNLDFTKEEMLAMTDMLIIPSGNCELSIYDDIPSDSYIPEPAGTLDTDILSKVYLGMTNEEVYALFGYPDFQASGLMWYGYTDVGVFDPSFSATGVIERISLNNGKEWDMHELISAAVIQHNDGQYYAPAGSHPTEAHTILALDADKNRFTVYIMSLWETFLPNGEYDVREVGGTHAPLALTFTKNQNGDYELAEYWAPEDGAYYMPSIRSKFPENTWSKVDTQLYIEAHKKSCYNQAMYFFVGALSVSGSRFGIGENGRGVAVVNNFTYGEIIPDECEILKFFPGATFSIEPYNEEYSSGSGNCVIEYTDSSKNIRVGREGLSETPITDDMVGIFDLDRGKYDLKFEKYTKN